MNKTTIYKLTNQDLCTYNNTQWALGEPKTTSGQGELCGAGFLHAYTDPTLALIMNPIHANFKNPRLFRGEGNLIKEDGGLKIGCDWMVLLEELDLPVITTEQRVRFAIMSALEVHRNEKFVGWVKSWLSGQDRSASSAQAAWSAAKAVWSAARAVCAVEEAARSAAWAVEAAALAARAAEYAVEAAAWSATRPVVWVVEEAEEEAARVAAWAAEAAAEAAGAPGGIVDSKGASKNRLDFISIIKEAGL